MSEFLYVVIAALGILVAGGIFGGFAMEGGVGPGQVSSQGIFFEHIGTIGAAADVEPTSRNVDLGSFTVEETSPNATAYETDALTIRNSAFSESSETIEFDAFRPQKAYLSFIATRVSSAENFILRVNGEQVPVQQIDTDRRVTIPIDGDLLRQGSNVIRLEATDPGLALWRSHEFALENVRVTLNDLQNAGAVKPFRVSDSVIRGFDHGEIRFFVTRDVFQDEPLQVRINGQHVATRTPIKRAMPYTLPFFANTTGLSAGENVLTFSTGGESVYPMQNVQLQLYYYGTSEERTTIRDFKISPAQYNALGNDDRHGQISFNVEKILLDRPLSIQLPNKSYMFMPKPGENMHTFDQQDIGKGENQIRLSTAGSYRITNFNVSMVKTD